MLTFSSVSSPSASAKGSTSNADRRSRWALLAKPALGVALGMARQTAHKSILGALTAWTLACVTLSAGSAKALVASIVVDNDWALFSGTKTTIQTLLYQPTGDLNNGIPGYTVYPAGNPHLYQNNLSGPSTFNPPASETHLWLMVSGDAATNTISGIVDGHSIPTWPGLEISSNLNTYFGNCSGICTVTLLQAQTALSSNPAFQSPTGSLTPFSCDISRGWAWASPSCIDFGNNETRLLRFSRFDTDEVPGPLPILGAAAALGFSRQLRKRIKCSPNAVSRT
jgi:hypothetical protein